MDCSACGTDGPISVEACGSATIELDANRGYFGFSNSAGDKGGCYDGAQLGSPQMMWVGASCDPTVPPSPEESSSIYAQYFKA